MKRIALNVDPESWYIGRLLTSSHLTVTRLELETSWSLADAVEAHEWLDALDEAAAQAQQP